MKTFGNILWYLFPVPFLGLIWVIIMFLGGVFWYMTILGIPLALGLFQIGKFTWAPFNRALITRKEYEMLTGEKQNTIIKGWSLVIRILYIPFGLIGSFILIVIAIASFITILGIPNGLVYIRLIPAVFNPIGKICVPRVVGEKVKRMKEANQLSKYTPKTDTPSRPIATTSASATPSVSYALLLKAQDKSDEELEMMLNNKEEYNSALITAAEEVLARRKSNISKTVPPRPETPQTESSVAPTVEVTPIESVDAPKSEALQAVSPKTFNAKEWLQKLSKPPYLYGAVGVGILLLAGIITCICLCLGGRDYESVDLQAYGLRGKVKNVLISDYDFTEQSGKIVRGAANATTQMGFDKNGYLSLYESDIIIHYSDDGTMISSNYLKKLNRNEQGQLMDAESMRNLNGEITTYQWEYNKRGFLGKQVCSVSYYTDEENYTYDKKGNLITKILTKDEGDLPLEIKISYRYLKFDKKDNWTERIVMSSCEDNTSSLLQVRSISYYKGNEKDEPDHVMVKKEYEGKIGNGRVKMSLSFTDFNVFGKYVYTKYNSPIYIVGTKKGDYYLMREKTDDRETGAFELYLDPKDGSMSGKWAGQGKFFDVSLRESKQ